MMSSNVVTRKKKHHLSQLPLSISLFVVAIAKAISYISSSKRPSGGHSEDPFEAPFAVRSQPYDSNISMKRSSQSQMSPHPGSFVCCDEDSETDSSFVDAEE
jgi:hypothetical protein